MSNVSFELSSRGAFSYHWNKSIENNTPFFAMFGGSIKAFFIGLFCEYTVYESDIIASGLLKDEHSGSIFINEYKKMKAMKVELASEPSNEKNHVGEKSNDSDAEAYTTGRKNATEENVPAKNLDGLTLVDEIEEAMCNKKLINIADYFSKEKINSLTKDDCCRLFKRAIVLNNREIVSYLLSEINNDKLTPLLYIGEEYLLPFCIRHNILIGVERILKIGDVDVVNKKDANGDTPLIVAAKGGNVETLKAILEAGATNEPNNDGSTPLHVAVLNNNAECMSALLGRDDVSVNAQDLYGCTPLYYAACNSESHCLDVLLAVPGIDVNLVSKTHNSSIENAVIVSNVKGVRALLDMPGIEIGGKDGSNKSLLHLAADAGNVEILTLLLDKMGEKQVHEKDDTGMTVFYCAAKSGDLACFDLLLNINGIDVDTVSDSGMTPLLSLAIAGHFDILKKLLSLNKVELNRTSRFGMTALYYSMMNSFLACFNELLEQPSIDVNMKDADDNTLLHSSIASGKLEYFKALLLKVNTLNLQLDVKNKKGQTPLHLAAQQESSEYLVELLEQGKIDTSEKDNDGNAAFHCVINLGNIDCLKALMSLSIDIDLPNEKGDTPISLAAQSGNIIFIEALLNEKADINKANHDGLTPLDYALYNAGVIGNDCNEKSFTHQCKATAEERKKCLEMIQKAESRRTSST